MTDESIGWHPLLQDPSGNREGSKRYGKTMVIDKGLGLGAFDDLLASAAYMDIIKLGFGTAVLTPEKVLLSKIEKAKEAGLVIIPGGTLLEAAVTLDLTSDLFKRIKALGFNGVEISDGTIEMDREKRTELILRGLDAGIKVYTEYGKKLENTSIQLDHLIETIAVDHELGAELITIEGRESGVGVGIYDEDGGCKDDEFNILIKSIPDMDWVLWEAPLKSQQAFLICSLGPNVHLGNISPQEVVAVEALRRGLRADTMLSSIQHLSVNSSFF